MKMPLNLGGGGGVGIFTRGVGTFSGGGGVGGGIWGGRVKPPVNQSMLVIVNEKI